MADFCDTSSRTLSNESVQSEESVHSDDDLSPEEMTALLLRAAGRVSAREASAPHRLAPAPKLPRLEHSALPAPYVRTAGQISIADRKALVPESTRGQAERARTIEDPVAAKAARRKGMCSKASFPHLCNDEMNGFSDHPSKQPPGSS
jgi:hypothetical protein